MRRLGQSLFPEIEADRRIAAKIADAMLKKWLGYEEPQPRQRVLLSGLDCLPGQMDLLPTDGEPDDDGPPDQAP